MANPYFIVDSVYGPPSSIRLPRLYDFSTHRELSRNVTHQVNELIRSAERSEESVVLPRGSLNSVFGDPASMVTKELRLAVSNGLGELRICTFSECEDIYLPPCEFLWKQGHPVKSFFRHLPQESEDGTYLLDLCAQRMESIDELTHPEKSSNKPFENAPASMLLQKPETIFSLLLDWLNFRERVAASTVSSRWWGIFKAAGACRVIDTRLEMYKDCSREFLVGALRNSVNSLETCGLVDLDYLSPALFHTTIPCLQSLRVLDLSGCTHLDRSCFRTIAERLGGSLELLYLKSLPGLDDGSVELIAECCAELRVIDLSYCQSLTGRAVRAIGTHLRHLRMFNVCRLAKLSAEDLSPLVEHAGSLTTISLRECHGIRSLYHTTTTAVFARLECLNLLGCHSLTDESLEPLACAVHMRNLSLAHCHRLTDRTLGLVSGLPRLQHLSIGYLLQVSKHGILRLTSLTGLRSLTVDHCSKLNTDTLAAVIAPLICLSEVRLAHCRGVNASEFLRIVHAPTADGLSSRTFDIIDFRGCPSPPATALPQYSQARDGVWIKRFLEVSSQGRLTVLPPAELQGGSRAQVSD